MPGPKVVRSGEVVATPGPSSNVPAPGDTGSWTAGPIVETTYAQLTIGGLQVVSAASCVFTFGGKDSSNAPIAVPSPVTLQKGPTTLQHGLSNVLRAGDSNSDTYGNTLSVNPTGNLTST